MALGYRLERVFLLRPVLSKEGSLCGLVKVMARHGGSWGADMEMSSVSSLLAFPASFPAAFSTPPTNLRPACGHHTLQWLNAEIVTQFKFNLKHRCERLAL